MSRELDIAVARAMGYRVVRDAQNVRGCQVGTAGRKGHDLPYYSEDAGLIPVLLAWIEAHDRRVAYVTELGNIALDYRAMQDGTAMYPALSAWAMLAATPEQHCKALIACTQAP